MANTTGPMKNKGQEGDTMGDKARNLASNVADKTKDAASSVAHTAGNVASAIGEKADSATSAVGSGMKSLGETIREKGPHSGILGSATSTVAGALESSGGYLKEHGLSGIGEDLTNLIRRNPLPALLLGIGVGYLIARATSSRS
jgi:hypothetical protein